MGIKFDKKFVIELSEGNKNVIKIYWKLQVRKYQV